MKRVLELLARQEGAALLVAAVGLSAGAVVVIWFVFSAIVR